MSQDSKNTEPAKPQAESAPAATAEKERPRVIDVVCRKPFKIGGREVPAGEKLAEVLVAPGVTLNILSAAIQNSFAHERPERTKPR